MPYLPSNINEMFYNILSQGIAFNNRYSVAINTPRVFFTNNSAETRQLSIRCEAVTIPGRSFNTQPFRYYGPARNMPYEPIYAGEITLTYILSRNMQERLFFEKWMQLVCDPENYKFSYYNDYTTDMVISVLGKDDVLLHDIQVEEVYPKSIGDIQLGYEKDNEIMRQDIILSFRKYTSIQYQAANETYGIPSDLGVDTIQFNPNSFRKNNSSLNAVDNTIRSV